MTTLPTYRTAADAEPHSRVSAYPTLAGRLVPVLALLLALWLGLAPLTATPALVPASAPATQFSAERAGRDLAIIASTPHPNGSPQARAVADYLVQEIAALGLEPQVQSGTAVSSFGGVAAVTAARNILVRLPGSANTGALLISAHYDSTPTGGGAADCAACTAAVLEALRVIHAGPQLENDVIFLFTDAEEVGDGGAGVFRQQHPWANDVAATLVFESLGGRGPSILYVHTPETGWLTEQALSGGARLAGYSFINDIMWNIEGGSGSDLDALTEGGRPGIALVNLSLAGSPTYHTQADNVANTDPGMLQSHGDQAVALVRSLGNAPLASASGHVDQVFFPLAPGLVARYGAGLAFPLAVVALIVFLAVVVLGLVRRRLTVGGLLAGAAGWLVSFLVAFVLTTLVWWLIRRANLNLHAYRVGGFDDMGWYLLAWVALTIAIFAGIQAWLRGRCTVLSLAAGALLWWAVLGVLAARGLPGLSYLFTWPALAAALAIAVLLFWPASQSGRWAALVAWTLVATIGLVLFAPVIVVLAIYAARLEAMMGIPAAALPLPFVALLVSLLLPLAELIVAPSPAGSAAAAATRGEKATWLGWLAAAAALLCLGLLAATWVRSAPSAARPTTNTVIYQLDTDRKAARWVTVNDSRMGRGAAAQIDAWTSQFFPGGGTPVLFNPWPSGWMEGDYPALESPAPVVPFPQAVMKAEPGETDGAAGRLRLQVAPPPEAIEGQITLAAAALGEVRVNGEKLAAGDSSDKSVLIDFYGLHENGIDLDLPATAVPVTVTIQSHLMGLPQVPGLTVTPRPASMMTAPFNNVGDASLVAQTWVVR